jgi:hypothetical protein
LPSGDSRNKGIEVTAEGRFAAFTRLGLVCRLGNEAQSCVSFSSASASTHKAVFLAFLELVDHEVALTLTNRARITLLTQKLREDVFLLRFNWLRLLAAKQLPELRFLLRHRSLLLNLDESLPQRSLLAYGRPVHFYEHELPHPSRNHISFISSDGCFHKRRAYCSQFLCFLQVILNSLAATEELGYFALHKLLCSCLLDFYKGRELVQKNQLLVTSFCSTFFNGTESEDAFTTVGFF